MTKEVAHYQKELSEHQAELDRMEAATGQYDQYDCKRRRDIVEETARMVPDSERRLETAVDELQVLVKDPEHIAVLQDSEWYATALQELERQPTATARTALHGLNGTTPHTNVDDLQDGEAF